jgi:hypothetical protein
VCCPRSPRFLILTHTRMSGPVNPLFWLGSSASCLPIHYLSFCRSFLSDTFFHNLFYGSLTEHPYFMPILL